MICLLPKYISDSIFFKYFRNLKINSLKKLIKIIQYKLFIAFFWTEVFLRARWRCVFFIVIIFWCSISPLTFCLGEILYRLYGSFLHKWACPPLCLFSLLPFLFTWDLHDILCAGDAFFFMKALVNYALIHTNKLFLHLIIYRKQNSQMLIMLIGCPPFPHTITMCCTAFNIAKIDTTELLLKVALYGCLFTYKSTVSMKILIWSLIVRKFIHFMLLLVIRKEVVLNPLHK
jgi:hypothetical protein